MSLLGLILLIFLILILVGGVGPWNIGGGPGYGVGHSLNGIVGLVLVIVLILFLLGRI